MPQEPSPSLQHFRRIQETQPPTKHRRTNQQNNNRSNAWVKPPSIIHQHHVSPNDTQTNSDESSLNDATNTVTKSQISILTQSIMTQLEEKFDAQSARNDERFNAQTEKLRQLSTTIVSNNERLNQVETITADNQKNFNELKSDFDTKFENGFKNNNQVLLTQMEMMMKTMFSSMTKVQINNNIKRSYDDSNDNNLS